MLNLCLMLLACLISNTFRSFTGWALSTLGLFLTHFPSTLYSLLLNISSSVSARAILPFLIWGFSSSSPSYQNPKGYLEVFITSIRWLHVPILFRLFCCVFFQQIDPLLATCHFCSFPLYDLNLIGLHNHDSFFIGPGHSHRYYIQGIKNGIHKPLTISQNLWCCLKPSYNTARLHIDFWWNSIPFVGDVAPYAIKSDGYRRHPNAGL